MTNRDYLRNLSNEKLAELLDGLKIFGSDCIVCEDGKCTRCITKWLDAKRETSVKKGQIREIGSCKWLIVAVNTNHDNCLMLSETGGIRNILTDTVDTWEIVTDETEEAFLNRVSNNLHKKFTQGA